MIITAILLAGIIAKDNIYSAELTMRYIQIPATFQI